MAMSFPDGEDPLARFVKLSKEKRSLENRIETIDDELKGLEESLLDEWCERGQQNANVDGMTVYITRDFYCTKKKEFSTEQLIELLKESGMERVVQVGYNASSLKSWVKETLAGGGEIPAPLANCLNFDTVPRLKARLS